MSEQITIWTLDWVPEGPRGFVRDLRLRWAAEEAGLAYNMCSVRFKDRETNHLDRQPFGQVPFLTDGDITIFESGAGLLHLARKSEKLMPRDPVGEAQTLQWTIAALNSVEMVTVPWWYLGSDRRQGQPSDRLAGKPPRPPGECPERAGMAGGGSLHCRRSADGGCSPRRENSCVRRSTGDGSLCYADHGAIRVQESPCRAVGAFRSRRRGQKSA